MILTIIVKSNLKKQYLSNLCFYIFITTINYTILEAQHLDSTSPELFDVSYYNEIPQKEPLVISHDDPTINISNDYHMDNTFCTLSKVIRESRLDESDNSIIEKVMICSKISEQNFRQVVKSINGNIKQVIHQIHITSSDSTIIFPFMELFCDISDCSKLTIFNVTGQEIDNFNLLSSLISSWPHLEVLDLTNTSLSSIELIYQTKPNSVKRNLTTLLLDFNMIETLDFDYIFERMPNLKRISIVNNTIESINCSETYRTKLLDQLVYMNFAGNAMNCDKNNLWLMKHILSMAEMKFPDHDKINCSFPERLNEMTWPQRVSVLETPICDYCDCKSMKRTAISVDCHSKNLTVLPDVLPLNTKILNLTTNRISSLGLPQNSKNWENVTYVYLENNLITSFQPLEINSKFMRNLAALDIRRNKFREFPNHIFEQFINLDQVHLSNNPWLCECEATFAFQEWLQRQFQKVGDKEEIMCGISGMEENGVRSLNLHQRLSSRVIYRLSKSELCPQDNLEEPYDWLDFVNLILGLAILLMITKVTLDYIYLKRTKKLPHFFKLNY